MAKLNINGRIRDVEVEPDTPLLWVIREQVGLTGTKYGCGDRAMRRLLRAHQRRGAALLLHPRRQT